MHFQKLLKKMGSGSSSEAPTASDKNNNEQYKAPMVDNRADPEDEEVRIHKD